MKNLAEAIRTVVSGKEMINPEITDKVVKLFNHMAQSSYAIQVDNELTEELTKTEWRVIQKIGCGMSNKEIASELVLSEGTVRNYLSSVLSKLELRDRTQLAIWAVQTGRTVHMDTISLLIPIQLFLKALLPLAAPVPLVFSIPE